MFTYRINAASDGAELVIYGDIGPSWFGDESISAKSVVDELKSLKGKPLTVRINSYGGSVSDGLAIYNALKRYDGPVTVAIDGMAVSCASLIAMAGQRIEMASNALLMIHAPWTSATGNEKDLRAAADVLARYAAAMISSYTNRLGEDIAAAWIGDGADHWLDANEALQMGIIDAITPEMQIAASIPARYLPRAKKLILTTESTNPMPPKHTAEQATQSDNNDANEVIARHEAERIRKEALSSEHSRRVSVRALYAQHLTVPGMEDALEKALDNPTMDVNAAMAEILRLISQGNPNPTSAAGNSAPYVQSGETESEKFAKGVELALLNRSGLRNDRDDGQNNYRGYSLTELARASLEMAGVRTTHMGKLELVQAAITSSTGDYANLLANVANKSMLMGYDQAAETFQQWTVRGTLTDFKQATRADLNQFPILDKVDPGGEYQYASVGDRGEKIALATYGKLFSITRQAIINDDLNSFTRIPQKMGAAAIRTVGNLVYAVLTGNPGMSDGVALFHATHNNLAGTGTVMTTANIDAARVAMGLQKDASGVTLNIRPQYLIVPMALGGLARQIVSAQMEVGAVGSKQLTAPNYLPAQYMVIDDPRLDAASTLSWYMAASAMLTDTIEVAYLDGVDTPTLEQQTGWTVDGAEFKVRMDAGVAPLDFRTLYKNPGA